jgi:hypothetical protein
LRRTATRGSAFAIAAVLLLAHAVSAVPAPSVSGYVRENPIFWESAPVYGAEHLFGNLLHLRQNLLWYPSSSVTAALEVKERVIAGDDSGQFAELIAPQNARRPYFDWTRSAEGDAGYADASIDRLWIDVTSGKLEIRAGRQRIAWGTNLVWNPIDIFNPSSFLDFDDVEKPGTDAARLQYYLGPASEIDVAWAPGRESEGTDAAVRIMANRWGYDLMVLGGRRGEDNVLGLAWSGSIAGGGFRGEALWGKPRDDDHGSDDDGSGSGNSASYVNASISGDYAFPNTVYLQISVLYVSRGTTSKAGGNEIIEAYLRGDLSPARCSLFTEVAKDLSPLWHADVSAIVNPSDASFYAGPSLKWSAAQDIDVTAAALLFGGRTGTEFGDQGRIWMVRAVYSF